MRKISLVMLLAVIVAAITSCNTKKESSKIMNQSDFPKPPIAEAIPDTFVNFGTERIDPYYWLKDKNNPKVIDYLKAENAYTDTVMASTKELQKRIYNEIIGRIKEDDESYPTFKNGYYYYSRSEKGKQYRTFCRRKGSMKAAEEIIFDVNKMAEGKNAFIFSSYYISPDNCKAAYFYNETGSYAEFTMKIKDLASGRDLDFSIDGASSAAWANDNKTLFYSTINKSLRSYRICRSDIDTKKLVVVYEEKDARFSTYVTADKLRRHIWISSASSTTSEERYVSADSPTDDFTVFLPRVKDVEYSVYPHQDRFYLRYKDRNNLNGKIYELPLTGYDDRKRWHEFVAHDTLTRIESIDVLKNYIVLELRKNGLTRIEARPVGGEQNRVISFPEPVYSAWLGGNPMYDSQTFRYTYTSLNRPTTLYEYNLADGSSTKLKEQEVPSGFDPDDYEVHRLWATAPDGVKVPMAVVYKKGLKRDGSAPALIYSYGSYGVSSDVYFSASYYSLIDRGFVVAIAQIRGGSCLQTCSYGRFCGRAAYGCCRQYASRPLSDYCGTGALCRRHQHYARRKPAADHRRIRRVGQPRRRGVLSLYAIIFALRQYQSTELSKYACNGRTQRLAGTLPRACQICGKTPFAENRQQHTPPPYGYDLGARWCYGALRRYQGYGVRVCLYPQSCRNR